MHNDPRDRPPGIFGKRVTLYVGANQAAYVILPLIPNGCG